MEVGGAIKGPEATHMIAQIPSIHDYVRQNGKAVGRCIACAYDGPTDNGMTGYECTVTATSNRAFLG